MPAKDEQTSIGQLAQAAGQALPLQVCQSAAGFYVGTKTPQDEPFSRESQEYWRDRVKAETALSSGKWTQRRFP